MIIPNYSLITRHLGFMSQATLQGFQDWQLSDIQLKVVHAFSILMKKLPIQDLFLIYEPQKQVLTENFLAEEVDAKTLVSTHECHVATLPLTHTAHTEWFSVGTPEEESEDFKMLHPQKECRNLTQNHNVVLSWKFWEKGPRWRL